MPRFESVSAALDFAIVQEKKAAQLYRRMAEICTSSSTQKVFLDLAAQENRHLQELVQIKKNGGIRPQADKVEALGIVEDLPDIKLNTEMERKNALTFALQREKAAAQMYRAFSEISSDKRLKMTFAALAQEEVSHERSLELKLLRDYYL